MRFRIDFFGPGIQNLSSGSEQKPKMILISRMQEKESKLMTDLCKLEPPCEFESDPYKD